MNIFRTIKSLFEQKTSQTNRLLSMFLTTGMGAPKDQRELNLAEEGYNQTVTVYACIREIAVAFSGIKWCLFKEVGGDGEEVIDHPILKLWKRPNKHQGSASFLLSIASHYCIAGNSYIEAATDSGGVPQYLYCLRPDRMTVIPDLLERIGGYKFTNGGQSMNFTEGEILHFKDFHPSNDWYGLSPISVAALSIDSFKGQQRWNKGLIENAARPSGIITVEDDMDPEQVETLREQFMKKFAGSENANIPLIMEGGKMKWEQMAFNAKELDFVASQGLSALQIAQVFNVPPELIGLQPATYQNRREARKALYTEVVLPMLDRFRDDLNNWLPPMFGEEQLFFEPDLEDVEALQEDREALWVRLDRSEDLTLNERRVAKGYDEIDDGDVIFLSSSKMSLEDMIAVPEDPPPMEEDEDTEDTEDEPLFGEEEEGDEEEEDGKQVKQSAVMRREVLAVGRMQKKFERRMRTAVKRLFKGEQNRILEALNRFGDQSATNINMEIDDSKLLWEELLIKNRIEVMTAFGLRAVRKFKEDYTDVEFKASHNEVFERAIRTASRIGVADSITNITLTTKAKVRKIIGEGVIGGVPVDEMADEIRGVYKGFSEKRSTVIALTESVTAQNRGSLEAMNSLKVPYLKVWTWSGVERQGHKEANGQTVHQEDFFHVSSDGISEREELLHPGDPMASAKNRVNCGCRLTYKRDVENDNR